MYSYRREDGIITIKWTWVWSVPFKIQFKDHYHPKTTLSLCRCLLFITIAQVTSASCFRFTYRGVSLKCFHSCPWLWRGQNDVEKQLVDRRCPQNQKFSWHFPLRNNYPEIMTLKLNFDCRSSSSIHHLSIHPSPNKTIKPHNYLSLRILISWMFIYWCYPGKK